MVVHLKALLDFQIFGALIVLVLAINTLKGELGRKDSHDPLLQPAILQWLIVINNNERQLNTQHKITISDLLSILSVGSERSMLIHNERSNQLIFTDGDSC